MARNNHKTDPYKRHNGYAVAGFESLKTVTKGSWQEKAIKNGRQFPIPLTGPVGTPKSEVAGVEASSAAEELLGKAVVAADVELEQVSAAA